jgi:hypothetical protein
MLQYRWTAPDPQQPEFGLARFGAIVFLLQYQAASLLRDRVYSNPIYSACPPARLATMLSAHSANWAHLALFFGCYTLVPWAHLTASTADASLQNASLTLPLIFLVHVWYFDIFLCNLKWTKTTFRLNFLKSYMFMTFWDRNLHKDCSVYIYLCLWKNIFVGQSYWLNCCGVWYSSGLESYLFYSRYLEICFW